MSGQRQKFENLQWKKIGCSNQVQCTSIDTGTDNMTVDKNKWVINLSSTPLTAQQERLLSCSPKFVIRPRKPRVREYIAAVEQACTKLNQGEADELHVEVKKTLKRAQNRSQTPSNITNDEFKALKELKEDRDRVILTADKGVALVIMEKKDYIQKAEELLNTTTYKKIPEVPTNKPKKNQIG